MSTHPLDLNKAFLGILVTVLLVVSVLSAGIAISSAETEDEMKILVYKRGIDKDTLKAREGYSVMENYDSFVLVETTKEKKIALEEQGFAVEGLPNRDYVGLQSHSFHSDEGEPEIADNLEIEEYSNGEEGYYILQFRGPIKTEWKEELESLGVTLHEFRHRFNFIVEMDQETRRDVEELDFVEWTGIYQPAYKFESELLEKSEPVYLDISLFEGADPGLIANGIAQTGGNIHYVGQNQVSLEVESDEIVDLANLPGVSSITEGNDEYQVFNARSTWVTQTNQPNNRKVTEKGVTADGELITVMDSGLNKDHQAFADPSNPIGDNHRKIQARYVPEGGEGDVTSGQMHGTHTTGTVLGESKPYGEYSNHDGHALEARVIFQDVSTDGQSIGAPDNMYDNGYGDAYERGARIHTNSWGGRGSGGYTEFTAETDQFIWDHKKFNVLFAAGNSGPDPNTLSPQAAGKNVIGVGAAQGGAGEGDQVRGGSTNYQSAQDNVADFSSRGYASDGRIKPDIVQIGAEVTSADYEDEGGYGHQSGTSMACPGMAGQTGQVRDYYNSGWYPTGTPTDEDSFEPSNALVRATLINGAVEMTGTGAYKNDARYPNNDQGFGRSKLDRAMYFEGDDRNTNVFDSLEEGKELETGDTWEKSFYVDDASEELEFTLAWTDFPGPEGADGSNPAIVNDLDLKVEGPNGNKYLGNAFTDYNPGYSEPNPEDNYWSGLRDENKSDGLNTIEDVLLLPDQNELQKGTYDVTVTAHNVPNGPQPFAMVVSGGFKDAKPPSIEITRPGGGETWEDGVTEPIEWFTSDGDAPTDTVDLAYSVDDGDNWTTIDRDLPDDGSYDWNVPDEWTHEARVRARVKDDDGLTATDISDQFSIEGTEPPSILLTRPSGGEKWIPTHEEDIEWNIDQGDGTPTRVDLEYSVDDGETWNTIQTGIDPGTSPYTWEVPDDQSTKARIRATVWDDNGLSGEYVSDQFTIGRVEKTLTINKVGRGDIEPPEGNHTYIKGKDVNVEATSGPGWYFDGWTGDYEGSEKDITITMDENKSITATFKEIQDYTLDIDIEGKGTTDPSEGTHTYTEGEQVTVTAQPPDEGWYFVEWTGDVPTGEEENKEITIEMNRDKNITAHFEAYTYTLEKNVRGEGNGNIHSDLELDEYKHGTTVNLTAEPSEGSYFVEWTGDVPTGEETNEEIMIEMDADKEITAWFEVHEYDLDLSIEGKGNVDIDPDQEEYEHGTEVTLTANPEEGWYFVEWSWDYTGTEEEITVTMDGDKEIVANFEKNEYDLTIQVEGEGSTEPSGGTHTYEHGERVTLTATPEEGHYLEKWSGDVPEGEEESEEITITMDENKEITANFDIYEYVLTINIEGEGIIDPGEGTHTYEHGEEVTLTATPEQGWRFIEWTGDLKRTTKEITLTMDQDKEVTANFGQPAFEVEITDYNENVKEGEEINIKYRVTNTGSSKGTEDIVLRLGGEQVAVYKDLTLAPGENYEGEFSIKGDNVGEHNLELSSNDDTSEGTMTIEEEGFLSNYWWVLVALLIGIIAVVALVFWMQQEDEEEEGTFEGGLPGQGEESQGPPDESSTSGSHYEESGTQENELSEE